MINGTKINWPLYYKEFSRAHGGNPVAYRIDKESGKGGYLLFRDGWMYHRTSIKGPEYAPLTLDDTRKKIRDYWLIRRSILRQELQLLKDEIVSLSRVQDSRSAPLIVSEVLPLEDEAGNRIGKRRGCARVDFDVLLSKYRDLQMQVKECDIELARLQNPGYDVSVVSKQAPFSELTVATELRIIELEGEI